MNNEKLSSVSLDEEGTDIFMKIDSIFRKEAMNRGGHEYHIPILLDKDVLETCGYFNSFPQHLTIPTYIDKSYFDTVVTDKKIENKELVMCNKFLTPSACLGLYPLLRGKQIDKSIYTMHEKVFRFEEGRFDGNVRLWDFTVREIVFVGEEDYVNSIMDEFKNITKRVADAIGIPCDIKQSTDHFYPSVENVVKKLFQKSNALKFEMVSQVNGEDVAIGSFNYHNDHFSKPFQFEQDGKIVSACIGYGLERWVAAIRNHNKVKQAMELSNY